MKKIYTLIIAIILVHTYATAQNPIYLWAEQIGSPSSSQASYTMAVDDTGNVYIAGNFSGSVDFDPGPGIYTLTGSTFSIFLAKYNSAGNFIWAGKMGGNLAEKTEKIVLDATGNIYITGYYSSATADFDPGLGVFNLTNGNTSSSNGFFAKYDNSGNLIWAKALDGNSTVESTSIAVNSSNEVYVTGRFYSSLDVDPGVGIINLSSAGSSDCFYAKYDASGNYIWANRNGGSSGEESWDIVVDNAGNLYIIGMFDATVDFDPSGAVANMSGNYDIFFAKYSTNGTFVWAKMLQDSWVGGSYKSCIRLDNSNNIYVTSNYGNAIDCDPSAGSLILSNAGTYDSFFAKYDNNGNVVFAKSFYSSIAVPSSGEYINDMYVDPNSGIIYLTGYYGGQVDFDPDAGTYNLITGGPSGWRNGFYAKYNATGNFVWANSFGPSNTNQENGYGIVLKNSDVYLTGSFGSQTYFDPAGLAPPLSSVSSADIFISKYSDCAVAPSQPGAISGLVSVCQGTTNTYSVTTVAGASSYTWTLPGGWAGSSTTNSINTTASATSGNITVTATNACGSSAAQTLAVTVNPIYTTNTTAAICLGDSILLAGAYKKTAGVYTDLLQSINGCDSTVMTTLTINPLPTVTLATFNAVCADAAAFALTGGLPAGGTYSGVGVNNNQFDAAVAGAGTHTINYTYTDGNTGCSNSTTNTIVVNPLPPTPIITVNGTTFTSSDANGNQWYLNGNPINGATGQTFVCTGNGNYTVCVTDVNGCRSCSTVLNFTTFGIDENQKGNEISIYPNPFSSTITVIASELSILTVYNVIGQEIYSSQISTKKTEIDLSNTPSGVYFIKLKSNEAMVTKKIIKQ